MSAPPAADDDATAVKSPQATRWLLLRSPDFHRPGPWTTTVYIVSAAAPARALAVSFTDHASGGVHVKWLNEKLLFLDVWWGRIVSTDLVLDVDAAAFVYAEDANYGAFLTPCEGARAR